MQTTIIRSALLLGFALPGLAQDPAALWRTEPALVSAAPVRAALPAPVAAFDRVRPARERVLYDEPGDGSVWARGADYKAGFEAGGVTFVPFQGSDAPARPVRFALARVTAGGVPLELAREVEPVRVGDRVAFERGAVTELYELAQGGMEQLFVLADPTPAGALVLELAVETDLACSPDGEGLRFDGERGGVRYGAATVLDAAGRSAPAPLEWTGEGLAIRVPAGFLAEASWPVTVDPLLTTFVIDDYFEGLRKPDVAYDVTTDSYLVVYEEHFTANDVDIYCRQISALGSTVLFEGYVNLTDNKWENPRVANHNGANRFLIVAQEELASGRRLVSTRTLVATTGALGVPVKIQDIEFVDQTYPDVGGDFFDGNSSWCVVWEEFDPVTGRNIKYRMVDGGGNPTGFASYLVQDTERDARPAISNSAGAGPFATSVWTVVWERGDVGSRAIWGAQIMWNGNVYEAPFPIVSAPDASEPTVSSILDGEGDRPYLVVCQRDIGDFDLQASVMRRATEVLTLNLTLLDGVNVTRDQVLPSVDSDGERFVLAFTELAPGAAFEGDLYMSTLRLAGTNLCTSEQRVRVTTTPALDSQVEVVTEYSGLGARRRTMAVWSRSTSFFDSDVYGALYDAAPNCVGLTYCNWAAPNSTGQSGRLLATGSHVAGGNPLTLTATGLPPDQFGYFLAAEGWNPVGSSPPLSQGLLCLSGAIARFSRPGEVGFSGPNGSFSLSVDTLDIPLTPPQPILAGEVWHFQGWYRDQNPGPTSNFTNAVRIAFE